MSKWFVSVTAGRWQKHSIHKARSLGYKVIAIDSDANADGLEIADMAIVSPLSHTEDIIRQIEDSRLDLQGVASFVSDAGMMLAAKIRDYFDLPGNCLETSQRMVNKALQRQKWANDGIPSPRAKVAYTHRQALEAIHEIGFPLIVKPADSSGSRGVTKIISDEANIDNAIVLAFRYSHTHEVVIEEFMDGVEFTVETFSVSGMHYVLAVTEKKKLSEYQSTVARELATPDRSGKVVKRLADVVRSAYTSLGYMDGPGHAEIMLMKDGTVGLVEVAGRGGGFMVNDKLVPAVSGVDVAKMTVLQAVGLSIEEITPANRAAVLRFFPSRAGRLVEIKGIEEANSLQGVEAGSLVPLHTRLQQASSDGDRIGWILTCADGPIEAQILADQAEDLLTFVIQS